MIFFSGNKRSNAWESHVHNFGKYLHRHLVAIYHYFLLFWQDLRGMLHGNLLASTLVRQYFLKQVY